MSPGIQFHDYHDHEVEVHEFPLDSMFSLLKSQDLKCADTFTEMGNLMLLPNWQWYRTALLGY